MIRFITIIGSMYLPVILTIENKRKFVLLYLYMMFFGWSVVSFITTELLVWILFIREVLSVRIIVLV